MFTWERAADPGLWANAVNNLVMLALGFNLLFCLPVFSCSATADCQTQSCKVPGWGWAWRKDTVSCSSGTWIQMGVKQLLEITTAVMLGRLIYAEQTTIHTQIAGSPGWHSNYGCMTTLQCDKLHPQPSARKALPMAQRALPNTCVYLYHTTLWVITGVLKR